MERDKKKWALAEIYKVRPALLWDTKIEHPDDDQDEETDVTHLDMFLQNLMSKNIINQEEASLIKRKDDKSNPENFEE